METTINSIRHYRVISVINDMTEDFTITLDYLIGI